MSIRDIAVSVRRNPLSPKPVNAVYQSNISMEQASSNGSASVQKTVLPIIDAESISSPGPIKPAYSRGTSISGIARQIESSKSFARVKSGEVSWENCKCLKRAGEKLFCTKFLRYCVKEKCPERYIEV